MNRERCNCSIQNLEKDCPLHQGYELLNPVFQIVGAKDWSERRDLCVVPYIRLNLPMPGEFYRNLARAKALEQLKTELAVKYDVDIQHVRFHFWANGTSTGAGAPQEITPN